LSQERFEPVEVLRVLATHRVRFVLIGGLAARAWGSPMITRDVDVCYARDLPNLDRLSAALREIHATLRGAPEDLPFRLDARTLAAGDHFTFQTSLGPLDCLGTPAGSGGFDALDRTSSEMDVDGIKISVASVDDLMRMKRAAGRNKDLRALEELGAVRDELEGRPPTWSP
jgi:hypothetical protein